MEKVTYTKKDIIRKVSNNLNISRISYLRYVFPKAIIIVPFRSPIEHYEQVR